jgi:hypothetical protein
VIPHNLLVTISVYEEIPVQHTLSSKSTSFTIFVHPLPRIHITIPADGLDMCMHLEKQEKRSVGTQGNTCRYQWQTVVAVKILSFHNSRVLVVSLPYFSSQLYGQLNGKDIN